MQWRGERSSFSKSGRWFAMTQTVMVGDAPVQSVRFYDCIEGEEWSIELSGRHVTAFDSSAEGMFTVVHAPGGPKGHTFRIDRDAEFMTVDLEKRSVGRRP